MSFEELALLFVVGLLVLGPARLQRAATEGGRWIGRARRMTHDLRRQLEREIAAADKKNRDATDDPS